MNIVLWCTFSWYNSDTDERNITNAILLASLKNIRTYIYFIYFFGGIFYIVEIIKKDKYDYVRYESLKYCTYSFIPNQNNFNQKFIKTIVCNLYSLTQ